MNTIGGRKFIFAIVAVVLSFALVILNKIESFQFISFVEIIGGTYIIGNVASKFADKE